MWIALIVITLWLTAVNLYLYVAKKDFRIFMGLSLSSAAFTACWLYQEMANLAARQNWEEIAKEAPLISVLLWIAVSIIVLLNIFPAFAEKFRKKPRDISEEIPEE